MLIKFLKIEFHKMIANGEECDKKDEFRTQSD